MDKDFVLKYNEISKGLLVSFEKADSNVVLSPMSAVLLLGIAADATDGQTRAEIVRALGVDDFDGLMSCVAALQSDVDSALVSSNCVCVRSSFKSEIKPSYKSRLRSVFSGELFACADLASSVNAWVKSKTRGMIPSVLDESAARDILACLINCIAFEDAWEDEYDPEDIVRRKFYNMDGTVSDVEMLESWESVYVENGEFEGFTKRYKNSRYEFMALLPKRKGKTALVDALKSVDFTGIYASGRRARVTARMPEFKYDFEKDLVEWCESMGIESLFGSSASFAPMTDAPLTVSDIIHKAHIEVDRHGTKAAAVTAAVCVMGCAMNFDLEAKTVILDRPFVYAIMDPDTSLPVFVGVCNKL